MIYFLGDISSVCSQLTAKIMIHCRSPWVELLEWNQSLVGATDNTRSNFIISGDSRFTSAFNDGWMRICYENGTAFDPGQVIIRYLDEDVIYAARWPARRTSIWLITFLLFCGIGSFTHETWVQNCPFLYSFFVLSQWRQQDIWTVVGISTTIPVYPYSQG